MTPSADPGNPSAPATVNEYDARQVWDLCVARGEDGDASTQAYQVEAFDPSKVVPAFDGDGVQVVVNWTNAAGAAGVWACAVNGDPANPTIKAFDIPHRGK
jgi:hypothetical protein